MKKTMVLLLTVIALSIVSGQKINGETTWGSANFTTNEYPQSRYLEAGLTVYGDLIAGQVRTGSCPESGVWRLLMEHNPSVYLTAGSQSPGPRYEIWQEKKEFTGYNIHWYIRHYIVITDEIGVYVDHGAGPKPLYYTYFISRLGPRSSQPFFYGNSRLVYSSSADVNGDGNIDILDLSIVSKNLWQTTHPQHPADVDGNRVIDRDDLDTVARLMRPGYRPSQQDLQIINHYLYRTIDFPLPAPSKKPFQLIAWAAIKR